MTNKTRNGAHSARPMSPNRRQFVKNLSLGVSGAAFASAVGLAPWPTMAAGAPLIYAFWPFGDQILADNARVFTEQ